jgi:ketosteroid isomerase-like protein
MASVDTIVHEVEAFYRTYIDGFNREDAAAFLDSFGYPHAFLNGEQGMLVSATVADHQRFYQQTMKYLHERGWGRSGVDRLQVWPFADNMAMIVADITRYKKDNTILEQGRYCYTLRKDGSAWKILTATEIKAPFPGPGAPRG